MEGVGLFPIEEVVSPPFGGTLEKHIELDGFPQDVEKVDFVWGGMVEKPKDFHSPIMPQVGSLRLIMMGMKRDWDAFFHQEEAKDHYRYLLHFLGDAYRRFEVYPPKERVFQAFEETSPQTLKAVILGQDPYHEPGQAMGLSFSVPKGTPLPPSLQNIYKEMNDDLGITRDPRSGDLTGIAREGVLFLNAYLAVKRGIPLSLADPKFLEFTGDVITYLDHLEQPLVFILWGGFARRFAPLIHGSNHLVLQSAHPSPLSANRGGFFGTKPFSKTNAFLVQNGVPPIDWSK